MFNNEKRCRGFVSRDRTTKIAKTLFLSIFAEFLLLQCSEAVPTREILNSNRKVIPTEETTFVNNDKLNAGEGPGELAEIAARTKCIINPILGLISNLKGTIGNTTNGLGSLFTKLTEGIGSIDIDKNKNKNGTMSTCKPIDPLLIANLPGIFIAVPLVIIGIAILIGVIAVIVIAIGGLGGELSMKHGDNETSGYEPSVMSMYGSPASSYGSPATGSSYSRLAANVDSATHDFNQAYDKYSGLMTKPQQQKQSSLVYSNNMANQYDGWNNNVVMKRMRQ